MCDGWFGVCVVGRSFGGILMVGARGREATLARFVLTVVSRYWRRGVAGGGGVGVGRSFLKGFATVRSDGWPDGAIVRSSMLGRPYGEDGRATFLEACGI